MPQMMIKEPLLYFDRSVKKQPKLHLVCRVKSEGSSISPRHNLAKVYLVFRYLVVKYQPTNQAKVDLVKFYQNLQYLIISKISHESTSGNYLVLEKA